MSGSNEAILRKGLEDFVEQKFDKIQFYLTGVCEEAIKTAVDARLNDPRARNFTGNLINSIACALYRDGQLVHASYSKDEVADPIRRKLTTKVYNFDPAWDGYPVVNAGPSPKSPGLDIPTGTTKGPQDALNFVRNFKPSHKAKIQLVFAYTTEYAAFVEAIRGTTGFLWATEFIMLEAQKMKQRLA